MGIYEELGIRRVINARATLTALGGSIMPQQVVDAMEEAARSFIDIWELQKRVGQELASLTHNEAAYVSCGAAAALTLATAACVAGMDADKRAKLPRVDETMKSEVIVHRHGRVGYDYAVRMVGVDLVEIGDEEGTACEELEEAINEKTAAIFYFANPTREWRLIPYEKGIEIAKRHDVPLIVDAAAQLPPAENLWRFTQMGADLVLFSGGKGLCGPQASGLTVGRQDLIDAMIFNGPPHAFIGRGMKVGKEELVGLLAAVRWYVGLDHKKLMKAYEDQVGFFREQLAAFDGVRVERNFPSEAGQPMPRTEIIFDEEVTGVTRDQIVASLRDGEPSIQISGAGPSGVHINPQTLGPGEEEIIATRIKEVLGGSV
jgi:L-seryl-tRNA(Ser) seleniumtransferase